MILTVMSAIKLVQQDYTLRICFNVQFEYMNFMYSHTGKPANNFFPLSLSPVICQAKDTVWPDMQPVWSDKKKRGNDMYTSAAFLDTFLDRQWHFNKWLLNYLKKTVTSVWMLAGVHVACLCLKQTRYVSCKWKQIKVHYSHYIKAHLCICLSLVEIYFMFHVITEEPSQHFWSDSAFAFPTLKFCRPNVQWPVLICRLVRLLFWFSCQEGNRLTRMSLFLLICLFSHEGTFLTSSWRVEV